MDLVTFTEEILNGKLHFLGSKFPYFAVLFFITTLQKKWHNLKFILTAASVLYKYETLFLRWIDKAVNASIKLDC